MMKNGFSRRRSKGERKEGESEDSDDEAEVHWQGASSREQTKRSATIMPPISREDRSTSSCTVRTDPRSLGMKTRKKRCVAKRRQMNALVAVKDTRGNGPCIPATPMNREQCRGGIEIRL